MADLRIVSALGERSVLATPTEIAGPPYNEALMTATTESVATTGSAKDNSTTTSKVPLRDRSHTESTSIGQSHTSADNEMTLHRPPSTRSLYRQQSYGDGHGFVAMPHHAAEKQADHKGSVDSLGGTIEVTWDGEDDPMNPRSMGKARKWLIVLIISGTSLCV